MHRIRNLEIHVAHGCNLSCESCSHYSNQGHKGMLSLADAERWMNLWSPRLAPNYFSLLGGEPTIHPDLPGFVTLARRHWPDTQLRLVTNGFFLHRHPTLPAVLQRDPNACIYLSIHHDAPEYKEKLRPIRALLKGWIRDYGIRVQTYRSFVHWTRRYQGIGNTMEPYADAQPRKSWENCMSRYCPQLFEGKIWKCAPLAYLGLQDAKYRLSESWQPYLEYRPLEPDCGDLELAAFFRREEEPSCSMCPANPEKFIMPMPMTAARTRAAGLARIGVVAEASRAADSAAVPEA
jgi:Radical SAM superfamily